MPLSPFAIGPRVIGEGQPAFIVAEGGINHLGRRDLAIDIVRQAAAASADAVKFQSCRVSQFLPRSNPDYTEYESTALSADDYAAVAEAAREAGIVFFSTPLDEDSADVLDRVGVPAFKVASCDLTHRPLLEHLAAKKKPIILSTGMADLSEIERAVGVLRSGGAPAIAVLQCVSQYPAEPDHVHLRAMATLRAALRVPVGLSDHTIGTALPIAAAALGASIIEKHFTLDQSLPGGDHHLSADPVELRTLVSGVRQVERALGHPEKGPTPVEIASRPLWRRIIVAARPLGAGAPLERADVLFLRPDPVQHRVDRALSPWRWREIEGRCLASRVAAGAAILPEDVGL